MNQKVLALTAVITLTVIVVITGLVLYIKSYDFFLEREKYIIGINNE